MTDKNCPNFDKSSTDCTKCKHEKENRELTAKLILLECKSFYNTFKIIEPYILKNEMNIRYSVYNAEDSTNATLYQFSYVVNGAFATELAIKYLLTLANIDYCKGERGHNLLDLYNKLSLNKKSIVEDKTEIDKCLCKEGQQSKNSILTNLTSIQDCYNRFRYCFSYNGAGYSGFFNVFVNVLCSYAIDKAAAIEHGDEI